MAVNFEDIKFTDEDLAAIKQQLELPENEVTDPAPIVPTPVVKRGRGRPRKHPLPVPAVESSTDAVITPVVDTPLPPAPMTKRDEREVASRLKSMLQGGTGVMSNVKGYLEMTDEEAEAISAPLASYLVRNADTMPVARQVLENYDLAAITLGVAGYAARVARDRREEAAANAASRSRSIAPIDRVRTPFESVEVEPEVRQGSWVSNADAQGSRGGL